MLCPFTTCMPCVPQSNRQILSIIWYLANVTFQSFKNIRARDLKFWENYYHTLCVMCPVSHVRWHKSLVTCHMSHFFFTNGKVSLLRVCYYWGLPRLIFRIFLFKRVDTQYLLNSACSGQFLVIKKNKLMKIEF